LVRHACSLLVAAAVALGACSRPDAPAPGPVAAASVGGAASPEARSGPAAEDAADEAAEDEGTSAEAEGGGEAEAAEAKGPFLWKVDGATPSYLFGTIHVPDPRVLALAPSVQKAFGEATAVYTEIPMDAATQMGVMGKIMLPEGQQLSEVIGQPLYDRMMAVVDKSLNGASPGTAGILGPLFQRMKPWAAMSQLSLLEFLPDMMAGRQPLDAMLYARAQQQGKKVGALETPDEQIAVFESFSLREQTRMLELTLDELERPKPGGKTQTQQLIDAYLSGDMAVVTDVMEEAMSGDRALMARFQAVAIDKRNTHMAERILALRKEQPSTVFFFAVGTAHYPGETGIVAQLRKAGLRVTRVP
jgi:uncharacterized protein YbaP (TraB family)